jgi:hypothetical protein
VSGNSHRLDELSDATVEQAEVDTEAVRVPPFAGVVSRAHRLAPDRIAADAVTAAAAIPQAPVQWRAGSTEDDARWLAPFVAETREQAELDIHGYLAVRAAPPLPAPASAPRRWLPLAVGIGAAVAAAIVLALVTPRALTLLRGDEARAPSQAADARDDGDAAPHEVERIVGPRERAEPRPQAPQPEPGPAVEPPPPPPPVPRPDEPSSNRSSLVERLARLDAEAERQLAEGDLAGADRTLARLVRLGGRHRLVELAYGDRFTIAHRQADVRRRVALWREYLRRFPRGRLSDDARAGVCRHAAPGTRRQCWAAYLADLPRGAYVTQAEAALASERTQDP